MIQQSTFSTVSVVIPTFMREQVLLDTVQYVLNQDPPAAEVILVDQTPVHEPATEKQLGDLNRQGLIRWIRLAEPSIPKSMNYGLRIASQPIVLFLDDDISADCNLVGCHAAEHVAFPDAKAVVGQVLQPGEKPRTVELVCTRTGVYADLEFPFFSTGGTWIANVMAGNLSVDRDFALKVGGFDENFMGVAYRFETEFARRLLAHGGKIRYSPEASINHLRASRGGTRSSGSHLTSADPKHGIGDYYFAFLQDRPWDSWRYSIRRMFREVRTRFHLTHPWWIPVKLVGEVRGFYAGRRMALQKRRRSLPREAKTSTE